jgi:hypothetical protein
MGLLAAILGHRLVPLGTGHDVSPPDARIRPLTRGDALRLATSAPHAPDWDSARAPLPDLSLVEAGMRPIGGGRRRSF